MQIRCKPKEATKNKQPLPPNVQGVIYFAETYPDPLKMWGSVWGLLDQDFHGLSINVKQVNERDCASGGNMLAAPG